jgi:glycosyltransferase involved in cell wall biosynthesis
VPPEIAVIVAAHNEQERLGDTLAALRAAFGNARVIVADDGSTDRTPDIARDAGAELICSERDIGKGGANTLAAERLLASDPPDVVLLCDGDLGGSAAALPQLVTTVSDGRADLAVAVFARRVGGGFGIAIGFAGWVIRRLTGLELEAPISGQRALRPAAAAAVLPFARGFGMEIGITVDAHRAGLRLVEVELDLEHRAGGRTVAGFVHRARQLLDFARVYASRR